MLCRGADTSRQHHIGVPANRGWGSQRIRGLCHRQPAVTRGQEAEGGLQCCVCSLNTYRQCSINHAGPLLQSERLKPVTKSDQRKEVLKKALRLQGAE